MKPEGVNATQPAGLVLTAEEVKLIRDAIHLAHKDLGDWVQLAVRQRDLSSDPEHDPVMPSLAGITGSTDLTRPYLAAAMQVFARATPPEAAEVADTEGE